MDALSLLFSTNLLCIVRSKEVVSTRKRGRDYTPLADLAIFFTADGVVEKNTGNPGWDSCTVDINLSSEHHFVGSHALIKQTSYL